MTALWLGLSLALVVPVDGVALTPHYEHRAEGLTFDGLVDDAAAAGAPTLSVVVQWSQPHITSHEIEPHPIHSQRDDVVRRIIRRARARGMAVLVFPILWVEHRAPGAWRGTLAPDDRAAWWRAYRRFILHYAELAAEERAALLSVGSELSSMERDAAAWRALIADVRARYSGRLLYSANWDHYAWVPFWDALDLVGITGYYRLAEVGRFDPPVADLVARWALIREHLGLWLQTVDRPLVITELGYPSVDGAAQAPWDYTGAQPVDLEEQRRCFQAFYEVWADAPELAGVFFWNWWGPGGPTDRWYTPRGKPAMHVVDWWYGGSRRDGSAPGRRPETQR